MSLLILGGTGEGRLLAERLSHVPGARISLAGATRAPAAQPLPVRIGGFGGAGGFADYLKREKISAVLDATHPFAERISARSRAVCDEIGLAYRQVLRPPWQTGNEDRWQEIAQPAEAAARIPDGARVFLATGRQSLPDFSELRKCVLLVRVIDPPEQPFPFPRGRFITGRPPFSVAEEIALLQREQVEWLVVKNSGGSGGREKLDAARALGLSVLLIARSAPPETRVFDDIEAALIWVAEGCPV